MVKRCLIILFVALLSLLFACSKNGNEQEQSNMESMDMAATESEIGVEERSYTGENTSENKVQDSQEDTATTAEEKKIIESDRKIMYSAHLNIEVPLLEKAITDIQAKAENFGGYIVDSTMQGEYDERSASGHITARIPQEKFHEFIEIVEEGSRVRERSISGQDVTEEYVDLESRLSSKRAVEERLLDFLEQAEKTEDLLKISGDLAKVQEEIERITGRMKYLQNKVDLATVTIYIQENDTSLSEIGEGDLDTWGKTKQQFLKSINFLITAASSLFVFFIGNLPILFLIGIIASVVIFIVRKQKKKDN
ncbi:DUF4349 domain-containing protein [Oceanobacillus senegalensis]|uniref:DUF4349 domain-containing protein n=1 Tax=Oceanobacillus senegalensis TaxID=1936063 RepID=UPI0015C41FE6|nr:DUF4349 domain-containing protein [Oceanobacillus senegalensis]